MPALDGSVAVEHRYVDLGDGVTIHVADAGPTDGPAVMVRSVSSLVPVSLNEPTSFQVADCIPFAFCHSASRDFHSSLPNATDTRFAAAMQLQSRLLQS